MNSKHRNNNYHGCVVIEGHYPKRQFIVILLLPVLLGVLGLSIRSSYAFPGELILLLAIILFIVLVRQLLAMPSIYRLALDIDRRILLYENLRRDVFLGPFGRHGTGQVSLDDVLSYELSEGGEDKSKILTIRTRQGSLSVESRDEARLRSIEIALLQYCAASAPTSPLGLWTTKGTSPKELAQTLGALLFFAILLAALFWWGGLLDEWL